MKEITKAKFINTWASEWDERTGWKVSEGYHKLLSEQLEYLINQEVEKRIAERMPSEVLRGFFHELIQAGRDMNDRDRLGLPYLTDDMYFMDFEYRFRSRLTNDSQKTEGGKG